MTIETEEIDNLLGSGNQMGNIDHFSPLFDINLLDEDIQELETKEIHYLSAYHEHTMLDRFLTIARKIDDVISNGEINSTNIVNYLTFKEAFEKYQLTFSRLEQLLERIKRQNERTAYNYISKESAEFLIDKNFTSIDSPDRIQEMIDEDGEEFRKFIGERIDSELSFLRDLWYRIFIEARFRCGDGMKEYVISEFRRFVKMDKYHLPPKLKTAAQHFKSDRLETISKPHWAKLAEADEELISKIINDEPVDAGACAYLYDASKLKDLRENKMLLSLLREASDPEDLFDWSILFSHDELFEQYVTFENVMFFFGRIHRQNLIKCEMYDGLKEQYHKFIYGKLANCVRTVKFLARGRVAFAFCNYKVITDFTRFERNCRAAFYGNVEKWCALCKVLLENQSKLAVALHFSHFLLNAKPQFWIIDFANQIVNLCHCFACCASAYQWLNGHHRA